MQLRSNSFAHGAPIPSGCAFGCAGGTGQPIVHAGNRNPHLAWDGLPAGVESLALLCVDPDAPTDPDTVNRHDRTVPLQQPRGEFVHWVLVDVPPGLGEIAEGACSDGVAAGGKRQPPGPPGSRQGRNDYGGWFAGDPQMAGEYLGYDGPCPPFNDERVHRYQFRLYALDLARLSLPEAFGAEDVRRAIQGHVLAEAQLTGTYAINTSARSA